MSSVYINWPAISIFSILAFLIVWAIFGLLEAIIITFILIIVMGSKKPAKPTKRRK